MTYFDEKQKHGLIIFVVILLFCVLASCSKVSPAITTPTVTSIRVVMDNNYPPYIFLDDQGNAKGILVDQWSLWEKRTGVKVELSAIPWEDALAGMKNGDFDVIDTIFYTDERAQIYDFTDPYVQIDVPIFFHNNISGIADAGDLRGFRVAVKSGDADAEYLIDAGVKNLVYYNSYEEIIRAAERKEETIFVIDQPPGLYFLYKYGLQNQFNHSAPLFSGEFHRAVKKGDPALLDLVVSGFANISEAEYQDIDNHWFGTEFGNHWQEYLPYLNAGALIALLIILILVVFNRTLQIRVNQRTEELKQALSNLQKSERKYREIFNATTEAIFIHAAPDGQLLHVNETMLQMYGYASEEEALSGNVSGLSISEPPYTQLNAQEKMRKTLEEGPQVFEWLAKKKTGEVFWTEVSLRSSQIGGEDQILAVVRDITERKQAEDILRQSKERYHLLFDRMADGLYRSTHEGKFVDINPAMVRMFGYASKEEMLEVDIKRDLYFEPEERGSHVLDTGKEETETYRMRRKDGSEIWVEDHGLYVHDEHGNLIFHEGMLRDVTERKRAEEALRESESLLKESQIIASIGSYVLDFSTATWKSSAALDNLFGIDDSYIRSVEGWADLIHPDHRQQMTDYFTNEVIGKRIRFDKEYKIVRKNDKAERWVHGLGELETDSQDKLLKMYGTIQDITERKQAEQVQAALYEIANVAQTTISLNDLFASIHKTLGTFMPAENFYIAIYDAQNDLLSFPYFIDQYDKAPAPQKPGSGLTEYVLHTRQPLLATPQIFEEMINNKQIVLLGVSSIDWIGVPLTVGDETFGVMVIQTYTDKIRLTQKDLEFMSFVSTQVAMVIKRKQTEEVLQQFRDLMDESNDAIFFIDLETSRYIDFNKNALEYLGYTREELRQLSVIDIAEHMNNIEEWHERVTLIYEKNGLVFETNYRRKNGTVFPVEVSARISNYAGKTIIVAMVRDNTERKQSEEAVNQRLAEQHILHQASQSLLAAHLDPETIYTTLHQAVVQIMPCDAFNIVLEDKSGGDYHAVYLYDSGQRFPEKRVPHGQGLSGKVISRGETLFIHDNQQANVPAVHYGTPKSVRSILAVPLRTNNETVGMVTAQSYEPNVYGERHRVLLETLAAQVTTVIENARLFEAERKQRKMSDALRDALSAGASMSVSLNFETILDRLLETLERVVPFDGGSIMFVQPEKQKINMARMRGYKMLEKQAADTMLKSSFDISSVENLRWVLNNKQPLIIPDIELYPNWLRIEETSFIRSWAGAPIIVDNEVIALFSLDSIKPNFFTIEHAELLRAFTGQASLALQNARLFDETARRAQEFISLYETSKALSADNDLNTLLKNIVDHAATLLNTATGAMYLYNPMNENLEIVVSTTPAIPIGRALGLGEGMAGRVAQTHQPMRVDDYSIWEGRSHKYDDVSFRAVLEVPMLFGGDLIGVLNVAELWDSNRIFTESDERLLSLFASQAAGVIHSASLREETERRAREFASLYETSNALSAENELNAMLQVIVEHAKKLLGSASSGMYLYLSETNELELTVDTAYYTPLGTRLQLNEGVAGRVAKTHQSLRIDDYSTWEGRSPLYDDTSIHAVLEVPMLYGGELIGVLTANEIGDSKRKFTEADEHLLSLFASQAAGAIHSARLREQTERRLNQLQALHTIDRAISSSFELRPILNTVISQTIAQLGVDAVDVLLYHPHLQTLEYVAGQGFRTRAIEQTRLRLSEGHAGHAAFERRTVHVPNLPETGSKFMRASLLAGEGFLEYYGVPLIAKGEIKGMLEVFHRTPLPSNPEWQDFLETLAGQAAITIDQTQLFDDLQRANLELIIAYDATIEGWSHAMDLRDRETEGHTLRVTEMTLALASTMGINEKEMLHIRRGALLHDIGKMGIPDNILLKEGNLTDEEWVIMRQHPTFSYEMLKPIKYLRQSLDIPYCHHEKWDGTGYPRGLKGEQIPLVARIFAVVDVWDAVTIDRPYRKAWTKQKALQYIREQSGKHFEPMVVKAFLKLFDQKTADS